MSHIPIFSSDLFCSSGIQRQAFQHERELQHALKESRKRDTVTCRDRQLLQCDAHVLFPVNTRSRLLWAKAVCRELQDFFDLDADHPFPDEQLFFVTLTDISCCTTHDASFVDIHTFRKTLRKGLRGLSYIGMIEPALYVNIAPGTRWSGKRAVSWHVHAICWGEKRKQMRKRFARLNKQGIYRSIMPGQRGAHQKEIPRKCLTDSSRTFFADKIRYMLKPPCKAYRIYHAKNPKNGEVVSFRQIKSDLRPGDHVDLFHLMKGLYLDLLAVGGGEGTEMLKRIKRVARADRSCAR
jgi:hypothetical protein